MLYPRVAAAWLGCNDGYRKAGTFCIGQKIKITGVSIYFLKVDSEVDKVTDDGKPFI